MRSLLSHRSGFTLLEVVIAMTIVGIAITGAAATFVTLTGQTSRVTERARAAERAANAEWLVRTLAMHFDHGGASESLAGDARTVTFVSWCPMQPPDLAACSVEIRAPRTGPGWFTLHMRRDSPAGGNDASPVQLWFVEYGRLRYLADASHGGVWADAWSGITAPVAIGIVMEEDTLVLRLGGDG